MRKQAEGLTAAILRQNSELAALCIQFQSGERGGAQGREAELGGVSVKIEAVNHPVAAAIYRSNSELAESFISGL
ncbi:hypothetical protein LSTR_LSTR008208 [Laodelphax striatellus]|uniref:Uncharacterized protein n=1 Tax=Laodelphax striatellus TaxID=195883 RepID=A0A482WJY0_LAOST|nr:hypothetical protein LSTR_LSTR008208 [Laodelphax striatellus]